MINLTEKQKFTLLGAGIVCLLVIIGLYFAFKSKNTSNTDQLTKYEGPIYDSSKNIGLIPNNVVFIYADLITAIGEVGFYKEELFYNGGCWTVNSPNKKWENLKNEDLSRITSIKLPAGIKATAYKYPTDRLGNYDPCDIKYKMIDINPGESKDFVKGSVHGFKFTKVSY